MTRDDVQGGLQRRGRRADLTGRAAEAAVERHYVGVGTAPVARRWRGQSGEIDLVVRDGAAVIFVEVKRARDFARAAESLTLGQIRRVVGAATEYLGTMASGQLTEVRFDLALVDGTGRVEVLENAFGA